MFKSIDYKLYFFISLLIISVVIITYCFIYQQFVFGVLASIIFFLVLNRLHYNFKKYNQNILFLLNALDNGDYAFFFTETKLSRREKELNNMMNRIKLILSKARQEVIEKELFLSVAIKNIPIGIIILDSKGNVKNVNEATLSLLGLSVFTHLNQLKIIDPIFPQLFQNLQASDEPQQIKIATEKEVIRLSLSMSTIIVQAETFKIFTLNDIGNELEKSEFESWMKLIRVMTHEIMNSVAPITSLTEMLLESHQKANDEDYIKLKNITLDSLSTINNTGKGLMSFIDSYRQFSGVAQPSMQSIDLLLFINSILKLQETEFKSNDVDVSLQSDVEDLMILGDQVQLTRVLVNLLKNAIEALQSIEHRRIKVEIIYLANDKIQLNVANNGEPVPNEILENIFIPFFTTKDSGSGVGLSLSRYIMRLHGGTLKHFNEEGWTVFSLTFKAYTINNKGS